jgi:hypothetical protein
LRPRLESAIRRVEHEHHTDKTADDQADHESPALSLRGLPGPPAYARPGPAATGTPAGPPAATRRTACPRNRSWLRGGGPGLSERSGDTLAPVDEPTRGLVRARLAFRLGVRCGRLATEPRPARAWPPPVPPGEPLGDAALPGGRGPRRAPPGAGAGRSTGRARARQQRFRGCPFQRRRRLSGCGHERPP